MSYWNKDWVRRWWPPLLVMLLIFIASSIPGKDVPEFGLGDWLVKKGGHMTGYALLAAGYLRALATGKAVTRRLWVLAVLLSFLYAATDEFHQYFVPGRNSSLYDVMIDTIGAVFGAGIWTWIKSSIGA